MLMFMPASHVQRPSSQEEELVRQHLPLVHHLVSATRGRIPSHVSSDDLTSAAMFGLLRAARAFDPEQGVPFSAYAATRIRGAILDDLRSVDWATRGVRARARSLLATADEMGTGVAAAAAAAGLSPDEAARVIADVERATVVSFDGFLTSEDGPPVADPASPEGTLLDRERDGYLRDAVAALPERLRHVVVGYFFEDRPLEELGRELGVSGSRASHMRAEALSLMQEAMSKVLDPDAAPATATTGVVARRRAAYCESVASASDHRTRLDRGTPVAV